MILEVLSFIKAIPMYIGRGIAIATLIFINADKRQKNEIIRLILM